MFGYVRSAEEALSPEDKARYQAAYCGLCHSLKEQCGFAARFVLNYDFVFLCLLLEEQEDCPAPGVRRCAAHPAKGRPCLAATPAMALCARESVILAYHKLGDGVRDKGFFRGLGDRAAALALGPAYRRAAGAQGEFDRHVRACLAQLDALERENSPQLDRTADAFARLLAAAAPHTGDARLDRPRQQLLYQLGRWIYLVDALDDLEEDRAAGRYNPLAARFGAEVDRPYLATTMDHSLSLARSAFQLLPENGWHGVLENILYLGLPNVQRLVAEGRWQTRRRGRGDRTGE